MAIHDFVRDRIKFGWREDFGRYKASEVLGAEIGFCMSKTTLFVAMLRAAGIPARPRFVDIHSKILEGFAVPEGYLDHSYAEVYIEGRWFGVDSYVVPEPMARRAQELLRDKAMKFGYGVALSGQYEWDGKSPSFIQYVADESLKGREFSLSRRRRLFSLR